MKQVSQLSSPNVIARSVSDEAIPKEIATLPLVARNDNEVRNSYMKQKGESLDWSLVLEKLDDIIAFIRLIRKERITHLEQTRHAA